jgi:hypothetical protein
VVFRQAKENPDPQSYYSRVSLNEGLVESFFSAAGVIKLLSAPWRLLLYPDFVSSN